MLKANKGFTFVEALVGLNITVIIVFTIATVISPIYFERKILYERREITSHLHDQLQMFIYNNTALPSEQTERINQTNVTVQFKKKSNYIEGCAKWSNLRERREEVCLYGISVIN